MKKWFALLAALAFGFVCAGCRQSAVSPKKPPDTSSTLRITAVLPHDDDAYWTSVANGALAAGEELPVSVKISLPSVNYSVPQMVELIKAAVAARVDAIIVQGVDDEDYIAALESAFENGIQVVFVDTDLATFPSHLYIGTDNYAAGRMIGEKLVDATGGSARIGVISGAPGYPNLELRIQGIRDVIAEYPDMRVERVEYGQYDSLTVMEKYELLSDPELGINTLVCVEGTSAMTLSRMLDKRSAAFQYVIGFDFSHESSASLTQGFVDGLVIQQPSGMGRQCVEEIYRRAAKGSYSQNIIHTATSFITADDLDEEGNYEIP